MWSADQKKTKPKKKKRKKQQYFSYSAAAYLHPLMIYALSGGLNQHSAVALLSWVELKDVLLSTQQHIWSLCSGSALILTKKKKGIRLMHFSSLNFFFSGLEIATLVP